MSQLSRSLQVAVFIWLVPFLASFGFYNNTGELQTSFVTFKISMVTIATISAILAFRWYYKSNVTYNLWQVIVLTTLVNIVLDILILILIIGMDIGMWTTTVLPVYLLMIPISATISRLLFNHDPNN